MSTIYIASPTGLLCGKLNPKQQLLANEIVSDHALNFYRLAVQLSWRKLRTLSCGDGCCSQQWITGNRFRADHIAGLIDGDCNGNRTTYARSPGSKRIFRVWQ